MEQEAKTDIVLRMEIAKRLQRANPRGAARYPSGAETLGKR
jgi:hypothetical protein